MFRKEETKLEKWKHEIEQGKVTDDLLEDAIKQGFHRAKNTTICQDDNVYMSNVEYGRLLLLLFCS